METLIEQQLIEQQLLERLVALLRSESRHLLSEHGLQPVQFEALHYLSISNRYSDTPMAVTEFLGQTKGTVSQTLKVLEKKGLLIKIADVKDKRVTHLEVTLDGRKLIDQILPSPIIRAASDFMCGDEIAVINSSLNTLLYKLQQANNFKSFGQCASCSHNINRGPGDYLCGLTKEPLTTKDVELICREHAPNKSLQQSANTIVG